MPDNKETERIQEAKIKGNRGRPRQTLESAVGKILVGKGQIGVKKDNGEELTVA